MIEYLGFVHGKSIKLKFGRKVIERMVKNLIQEVQINNHISHAKIIRMLKQAKVELKEGVHG